MKKALTVMMALVLCAFTVLSAGLFSHHAEHACGACDCVFCETHERQASGACISSDDAGTYVCGIFPAGETCGFQSLLLPSDTLTNRKVKLTN